MNINNPTTFGSPALVYSTSNSSGTGGALRADDTLAIFSATVPTTIAYSASAATGDNAFASREDHVHGVPIAPALHASGSYDGDGETSQAITGVGFTVKWLMLSFRSAAEAAGASVGWLITSDTIIDDNAAGMSLRWSADSESYQYRIDAIIALGSDGFTVDDDAADRHPNKNGSTYNYTAIG